MPDRESNPDFQDQNLACYHYTTRHSSAIILGLMAKNKKDKKGFVIFVAIATTISLAGLTGLFGTGVAPQQTQQQQTQESPPTTEEIVQATGVPCLTSEEFHLHPRLTVTVDGEEQPIPANILSLLPL